MGVIVGFVVGICAIGFYTLGVELAANKRRILELEHEIKNNINLVNPEKIVGEVTVVKPNGETEIVRVKAKDIII